VSFAALLGTGNPSARIARFLNSVVAVTKNIQKEHQPTFCARVGNSSARTVWWTVINVKTNFVSTARWLATIAPKWFAQHVTGTNFWMITVKGLRISNWFSATIAAHLQPPPAVCVPRRIVKPCAASVQNQFIQLWIAPGWLLQWDFAKGVFLLSVPFAMSQPEIRDPLLAPDVRASVIMIVWLYRQGISHFTVLPVWRLHVLFAKKMTRITEKLAQAAGNTITPNAWTFIPGRPPTGNQQLKYAIPVRSGVKKCAPNAT
jgi:hypothetical protein